MNRSNPSRKHRDGNHLRQASVDVKKVMETNGQFRVDYPLPPSFLPLFLILAFVTPTSAPQGKKKDDEFLDECELDPLLAR
ncbi:hypothetical protein BT69DRAFT_1275760 [Atractiella rhizophila]|nr:hypothetical protein BT69DRAFT_1275760 [Atractiella rhizophila]